MSNTINLFESIQNNLNENEGMKVISSTIENLGGGTMAVFGELANGQFFAGNEDGIHLYNIDVRPLHVGEANLDMEDDEDFGEALDRELEKHYINSYDNFSEEYKTIIKQTKFFDEDELEESEDTEEDDKQKMIKRIEEATGYDLEECERIYEDGEYVFFPGVEDDLGLGKAYVDMVGFDGVANLSNFIDRSAIKTNIINNMNSEEDYSDEELDAMVEEDIALAIDSKAEDYLKEYFDYDHLGHTLGYEGYTFIEDGCIGIFA